MIEHEDIPEAAWYVYMVRCADNSLYTGITTELTRRIEEHNNGVSGAKYTRGRRPVELVWFEAVEDRSAASRREAAIKRLRLDDKLRLMNEGGAAGP